jgi:glutamyl-tRNA synthetase
MMPSAELAPRVMDLIASAGFATKADLESRPEWFHALLDQLKVRARTLDDIVAQSAPFLHDTVEYDADAVAKAWKDRASTCDLLQAAHDALAAAGTWDAPSLEQTLRTVAEARSISAGKLFSPLRVALTGLTASPGMFDVLVLLGRDRSLERIGRAVRYLTGNNE